MVKLVKWITQRMWQYLFVVITCLAVSADAWCTPFSYGSWHAWSSCTRGCGGGTRHRSKYSCVKSDEKRETGKCNEFCYYTGSYYGGYCHCPEWRSGSCCETCKDINIPYCKPGQYECGGSPDKIKCTDCQDPYYPAGFGHGCALCQTISNCKDHHCTNSWNTKCLNCTDDRSFFLKTHHDTKCERMCAWNNHYCWPGSCPDKLTSSCTCAKGFHAVKKDSETSCQLSLTPTIETCETKVAGPNGELKRAKTTTTSTDCGSLADFYGNFQPRQLKYDLMTSFPKIAKPSKPDFINESNFGVTDTTVILNIHPVRGPVRQWQRYSILEDTTHSTKASPTFADKQNRILPSLPNALETGEMLCIIYEAKGGGYLKSVDTRQTTRVPSAPVPYTKTASTKRLCYRYDSTSPNHCAANGLCSYEPIQLSARITRSDEVSVGLRGWTDPIPPGGNSTHASGIELYEITLHEVTASKDVLKVSLGKLYNITVKNPSGPVVLNLSSNIPKLYAIYLEVKDTADNTKQSRRFVLYDNSSKIDASQDNPFFVESASQHTNYTWQTHHHDICLNWTKHFYNRFYFDNPLLNRIETDPTGLISGKYDQIKGILPVSGTPNINGILQYKFSWTLNGGNISSEMDVPNFLRQHYCQRFNLYDGETYTLNIRAIDVVNNSFVENRTVHIDRSVPHINNLWLVKDGVHRLFVHDRTDLSNMKLYFEALDPHSGIREIHWLFGTTDSGSELLTGNIAVNRIDTDCPSNSSAYNKCYCPDVGKCEMYQYTLPMNKLVQADKHIGDHNRNYYFTIKVVNHAQLSNIEHLDILVDDSPPETGVMFEGPESSPDFDYTSDDSFLVHWHGFIDHESGIKSYQIALSDHCLTRDYMGNATLLDELPVQVKIAGTESSVRLPANFTGKMYTTIVAVNNAMDMSDPVCSDGITRDISAPYISNITLQNARWSESLLCLQNHAWLLNSELKKVRLHNTTLCANRCSNFTDTYVFPATIPTTCIDTLDEEMSNFRCSILQRYDTPIIYLPDDHIYLQWDVQDAGSQTNDYFVGIGLDASEASNPSQLKYTSTGKKTVFNKHHVGIGSSELFFIFLKAENKAGLTRVTTVGPLLIDQTPPLSKHLPSVKLESSYVVVTWDNDTFYDLEQTELIDQIYFQFARNGQTVTPMMEWRQDTSADCSGHIGFCIKYPVKKLQQHDTEFGFDFHISLFVYNKAGHFLKLDTEEFRLPSKYPPCHAAVLDVDPRDTDDESDVDVHFSEATLCAKWTGFRHHENITLEFGIGSGTQTDDVIPFTVTESDPFTCVNSSKLLPGVKYHALLRATCSGGKTVSASNGVTILTQTYVDNILKVHVGENCQLLPQVEKTLSTDLNGETIFNLTKPVRIGHVYNIYVHDNISVVLEDETGILTLVQSQTFSYYYKLVPFVHWPIIKTMSSSTLVKADMIDVVRCPSRHYIRFDKQSAESYWHFTEGRHFPVYFKVGFMKEDMGTSGSLRGFVLSSNLTHSRIQLPHDAKSGMSYRIAVRTCSRTYCFEPVLSDNFTLLFNAPDGNISIADIDYLEGSNCFTVDLQWEAFTSESPVVFYQWSISEDVRGRKPVTPWSTLVNQSRHQYQVNKCMSVPHDLYKTLFACVRAYTEGEQSVTMCKELRTTPGAYRRNVVYDIDSTGKYWMDIKTAITSSNLGELYKLMHESELDFGNTSARVAGVVEYGTERSVEWFLMKRPELPGQCQKSSRCLQSLSSNTGFIEFDTRFIVANTLYYICARSNVTYVEREMFTERLEEIRTCSDGFVLDDSPPSPGVIHVSEQGGFLTDITHIEVSWDGFKDNIDATKLGYVDSIRSYSFAIGSRPGGDDIAEFSDVGLSNIAVTNITGISDGTILYFTVKAFDHSGLSTTVTSREETVDTSPPTVGQLMVNQQLGTKYITTDNLNIRPVKFLDEESGIHRYEITVGTSQYAADIVSSLNFTDDVDLDIPADAMNDGHTYYATLKAINRAGLESALVTEQFIFDRSSPTGGSVVDGDPLLKKDINFQTDTHHIKAHWKGFDDIHSGIKFYRVGLGLQPYEDDVEPIIDVGLHTEIAWNGSFVPGQMYYTVVEACNNAGLCSKKSSNGIILDNSPPIVGLVRVGSSSRHQTFIPRSSSVQLHWHGFEDPQSGIERFEACIGSEPGKCDIEPTFHCLLQSNIMKTGLKLPAGKYMYATVTAFNKVGTKVNQSSDAFTVDESPPSIASEPSFILDYKNIQGFSVQWEPSLLGIAWEFKDDESPIIDHTVTVKTHHEGHTPVENVHLGNENSLNISLDANDWLKSGDKYYVVVTSCNAARHCSSARSPVLLIDSTPPHLGGFRPPLTWMTRTYENVSEVNLTWYGFHDPESGIKKYFITASHSYSGNELTNGEITVVSNSTDALQQTEIKLSEKLNRDDMLILSIWAQNYAGLNSSIARVSVQVLSTSTKSDSNEGILELEKHSCDAHYCNKDCTCAVIGKPCIQSTSVHNCTVLNTTYVEQQNMPTINVFGGLKIYPQQMTASSACLSGHWRLDGHYDLVSRFEWSMGLINQPIGEGVFDIKNEIPWRDVGLRQEIVHCLTSNQSLIHNHEYVIYIRAWYSSDLSAIFTSKPIRIDQTPPAVRRGKYIRDSNTACTFDFDFIDWVNTITACWDNVFSEQQSKMNNYVVSLSTSPMADDVFRRTNVGLKTQLTLTNLTLSHGTKYYFSVTAFNNLGLHTFLSSDGFVVDTDIPIAGVVFNTGRHVNAAYQSFNNKFSLSWHGFIDRYSGIRKYYAAIAENTGFNLSKLIYHDVGHQNSFTFENIHLEHGKKYIGIVKAVDAAGHESKISVSPVTTVDTTPPEGYECLEFQDIISDTIPCSLNGSYVYHTNIHLNSTTFYRITGVMPGVSTAELKLEGMRINIPVTVAYDGSSRFEYIFLQHEVKEGLLKLNGICSTNTNITARLSYCSETTPGNTSAVTVQQITSADLQIKPMVLDNESQIKKILVGLGTTPGGFQIKPLSEVYRASYGVTRAHVPHGSRVYTTLIAENYAGLRSVFYAKPITIDHTAPVFHTSPTAIIDDATNDTRSVTVTWGVADIESGITKCLCGLGSKPASVDLYEYTISENTHDCRLENMSLKHGDTVYVSVLCVNSVELSREHSSQPLLISEEPPTASTAVLTIVPSSDHSPELTLTNKAMPVQTNLTSLQMQWSGFTDVFKIDGYEYRLKQGEAVITDWTDAGKETMATIYSLHLQSGLVYSAEVRAVSVGHHSSDAVRSDVLVLGEGPKLSGDTMQMIVSDRTMQLDWSTVYNLNKFANVSYILIIGTQNGYTDVIDNLHTTDTSFSFIIPGSTLVSPKITEIFIELTCAYATGMSTVYRTSYKLI